jgi:hypothetical protein
MVIEAQLRNHRRGHWTLQWQDPQRNVWRVEHFSTEKQARLYTKYDNFYQWKIKKIGYTGHYAQLGYWHGN